MREDVQISYRGAKYELGQGPQFYGIWATDAPQPQPLEWWPKTPAGWSGAWARFVSIETPGTIGPVGRPAGVGGGPAFHASPGYQGPAAQTDPGQALHGGPGPDSSFGAVTFPAAQPVGALRARIAGGLIAAGVALGVVGLFPSYLSGSSLASQAFQLVPHLVYLIAWATAAVLIALGGPRLRIGALLGVGTSAVTFGLFFADAGEVMGHEATAGPGLSLGLVSWLACAAGSAVAFQILRGDGPGKPDRREIVPVATLIIAALGAAIAFAPAWDSFLLRWDAGSTTTTLGNAFSNPAAMIVGDVVVMVAVVAVVAAAALWRPARHGGVLVIGAAIPLAAQAISALLQLGTPTSPSLFGISQSEALQIGLTIRNGLTPMFWVYCGFVVTLALLAGRMLIADELIAPRTHGGWTPGPASTWTPMTSAPGDAGHAFAPAAPATAPAAAAANWPFFAPQQDQQAGGTSSPGDSVTPPAAGQDGPAAPPPAAT